MCCVLCTNPLPSPPLPSALQVMLDHGGALPQSKSSYAEGTKKKDKEGGGNEGGPERDRGGRRVRGSSDGAGEGGVPSVASISLALEVPPLPPSSASQSPAMATRVGMSAGTNVNISPTNEEPKEEAPLTEEEKKTLSASGSVNKKEEALHLMKGITGEDKFGTVGAVVRDLYGNLAAAGSTGGLCNKMVGRVGDTPIYGSGIYANRCGAGSMDVLCVSCVCAV